MSFINSTELFLEENADRLDTRVEKLCTFGLSALDDPLLCIRPNDLVVIGADSGAGKSECAVHIARHNAKQGKKVALFYLEGGHMEAMARMKWRDICHEYFTKHHGMGIPLDYQKWSVNKDVHPLIHQIEQEMYEKYKKQYKENLLLYKIEQGLSLEDFLVEILDFHGLVSGDGYQLKGKVNLDLIIIDHLQYFSLNSGENEIQEITKILREVKKITDTHKVPVVLISHLRKRYKDRGLPDQEDLYGSSNIAKIASCVVMVAKATGEEDYANGVYPTYLRVVKSRVGISSNLAMKVNFKQAIKSYDEDYSLYRVSGKGEVASDPIPFGELPKWAKHNAKSEFTKFGG